MATINKDLTMETKKFYARESELRGGSLFSILTNSGQIEGLDLEMLHLSQKLSSQDFFRRFGISIEQFTSQPSAYQNRIRPIKRDSFDSNFKSGYKPTQIDSPQINLPKSKGDKLYFK
jgi:hypothetical protein